MGNLSISVFEAVFICVAMLLLYHFYRSAVDSRKRGKGLLESGKKSVSAGQQQLRDGRRSLSQSLACNLMFLLILLASVLVLGLRACVGR
jgi:hypothetical protein